MKSGMHESFSEHRHIEGPSDRSFGLTVGGIFVAIGLARWLGLGAGPVSTAIFLAVGIALLIPALAAPGMLAPLNRAWLKLGLLLARLVNPVIMLLMFALIFVPVAVAMRIFRRDTLRLRQSKEVRSYWIERDPPGPSPETIINQF